MRILNADDVAENRYLLEFALKNAGHEVVSARDGEEALAIAEQGHVDVVVSDVLMPRMDGFQLCRELKKRPSTQSIPFVFYTATYTDEKDAALGLSLGAARFVVKPQEPQELLRIVQEVIQQAGGREGQVPGALPEQEYLASYSQALVRKLDAKVAQLSALSARLQQELVAKEREAERRQQMEEVARQAQKMENLGMLAAGIAHDFNNVLTSILMNAESLLSGGTLGLADQAVVREVAQAAERAAQLTRQLLTFAQRRPLVAERLDVRERVRELIGMLRRIIGENVQLEYRLPTEPLEVTCDVTLLEQVLMNLVVNARDAMPQGGQVRIEVDQVEVDEAQAASHPSARAGSSIRLSVLDTGVGIRPEHLARVFDPFFTTKPAGKGTGLGLSTVHGIVGQHRGWVTVESKVGQGTRFDVYLPLAPAAQPAQSPELPAPPPAPHGEHILLVEDDEGVRALAARHLRQIGYHVLDARDGPAALAAFSGAKGEFDLLVTDLLLPGGMGGQEVARRLRQEREGLRVLYVTGYGGDAVEGLSGGGATLLSKPITPVRLERAVRSALDGGSVQGARTSGDAAG